MYYHKEYFEDLLNHKNGLSIHSVHIVPKEVLDLDSYEQLKWLNLSHLNPISFTVDGLGYCNGGSLNKNGGDMKGVTLNVFELGRPSQIILIQDSVTIKEGISQETLDSWDYMMKLIALAHELGHVEDMKGTSDSNFSYEPPRVNLVEAEAYAHAYCLNYLHKIGATIARDNIAHALYKMESSNKQFEQFLFLSICRRIGKGRIKKWARS